MNQRRTMVSAEVEGSIRSNGSQLPFIFSQQPQNDQFTTGGGTSPGQQYLRRTQYQTIEPRFTTGPGTSPGQTDNQGRRTQYQVEPRFTTGGGTSPGQTDRINQLCTNPVAYCRNQGANPRAYDEESRFTTGGGLSPGQQYLRKTQLHTVEPRFTTGPGTSPGQTDRQGRQTQYQVEPRFTTGGGMSPGQTDNQGRRTQYQADNIEFPPTKFPCMKPGDWCLGAGMPNTNGPKTPQDQCDPAMPSCRR